MSAKKDAKSANPKRDGGAAGYRARGLVSLLLAMPPETRRLIHAAVGASGASGASDFAVPILEEAARKVLRDNGM